MSPYPPPPDALPDALQGESSQTVAGTLAPAPPPSLPGAPSPYGSPYNPNPNPYPPYPAGYMPYYPGPMAPSTSYWAIASMVCALGGFALVFLVGLSLFWILIPILVPLGALLAVIFGHIALVEIARSRGRLVGRGTALVGLITGYVILAIALFLGIVALSAASVRL